MCCYANLCYDECNIVVWWIWPARCRPTETKPDETRYYQMQSGRICPMVSFSDHRGLMHLFPSRINVINDHCTIIVTNITDKCVFVRFLRLLLLTKPHFSLTSKLTSPIVYVVVVVVGVVVINWCLRSAREMEVCER